MIVVFWIWLCVYHYHWLHIFLCFILWASMHLFHLEEVLLAFPVRQTWWFCSGMSLPLHPWRTAAQVKISWLAGSFSPVVCLYYPTLSWPTKFLLRNSLTAILGSLYVKTPLPAQLFVFDFCQLVIISLGEFFFKWNWTGDLSISCSWIFKYFSTFERFSAFTY